MAQGTASPFHVDPQDAAGRQFSAEVVYDMDDAIRCANELLELSDVEIAYVWRTEFSDKWQTWMPRTDIDPVYTARRSEAI